MMNDKHEDREWRMADGGRAKGCVLRVAWGGGPADSGTTADGELGPGISNLKFHKGRADGKLLLPLLHRRSAPNLRGDAFGSLRFKVSGFRPVFARKTGFARFCPVFILRKFQVGDGETHAEGSKETLNSKPGVKAGQGQSNLVKPSQGDFLLPDWVDWPIKVATARLLGLRKVMRKSWGLNGIGWRGECKCVTPIHRDGLPVLPLRGGEGRGEGGRTTNLSSHCSFESQ